MEVTEFTGNKSQYGRNDYEQQYKRICQQLPNGDEGFRGCHLLSCDNMSPPLTSYFIIALVPFIGQFVKDIAEWCNGNTLGSEPGADRSTRSSATSAKAHCHLYGN